MAVDILAIAENARKEKLINPNVIDATIGMFYDENKNLVIPYVNEKFYTLKPEDIFPYGSTSGGELFKQNLISWVFYKIEDKIKESFKIDAIATPGGSGALSIIFNTYGKQNESILVSHPRWRYEFFTDAAKMQIASYDLFLDDKFNLKGLEQSLNQLLLKQEKVILVINDPCHNPTGYELNDLEWEGLINLLNTYDKEIILVLDIAYADYNPKGFVEQRNKYINLKQLNSNILPLIVFSASKSFSIYGVRLGGLIGLFQTDKQESFFKEYVYKDALGKWSTAPSVGVSLFNEIMKNKEDYIPNLEKVVKTLKNRGDLFLEKAKEHKLDHYPYSGGFFVLIKSTHPLKDYERLIKENVYVIPMEEGLRVALCSISYSEVSRLVEKVSKTVNKR
ncbi:Aromatic-amino-acid transaminase [Alteracholeplasma palmae J233]|uniref:Aromatic-amino-acid transaminase n=1 Tax=Alteracholeplasma palmae (strain ATCC 49389 / J233) TaxID=1318466 RepID=U4KJR6_ALTPJ|nr:aminotransferase class I/II-fold pyridoxal phosphate-dependent enzyme [Alteracholeplasma palmae]CCV63677.1 Aromatic-amino-acid transaminase [Alteracholeplasma palmae J233]